VANPAMAPAVKRKTAAAPRGLWKTLLPYLFIAPSLLIFATFDIYPIFYSLYLSFMKWNLISPEKTFVGFDNYTTLATSEEFRTAISNTVLFTIGRVFGSLAIAMVLAMLLNTKKRWATWTQAAVFSPHVISMVSVSILWLWLMDPTSGLLNYLLGLVGISPLKWLAASNTALMSVIIVTVWKAIGYDMVILLSGMQSIPEELYEAAKIDGAHAGHRFFKITIPMLSPTIFFLMVTSTIASFQVFDSVRVMTGGGPGDSTNVLVYYIYQYGFRFFKIGQATAASIVLFLIVLGITIFQFKVVEKKVHYS
jgi:sn-glycerol 3-phosphate transport system permease protein